MERFKLFLRLYVYALYKYALFYNIKPKGLQGSTVGLFVNIYGDKTKKHGVVVFVMPEGHSLDTHYIKDMNGPFGDTSLIDKNGEHLYGLDKWGALDPHVPEDMRQIAENPLLLKIWIQHPDQILQLAGVRNIFGFHPWPLKKASRFILPRKFTSN
jgi:hypothetical protein